jgi:hypothetical protein
LEVRLGEGKGKVKLRQWREEERCLGDLDMLDLRRYLQILDPSRRKHATTKSHYVFARPRLRREDKVEEIWALAGTRFEEHFSGCLVFMGLTLSERGGSFVRDETRANGPGKME